MQGDVVTPKNLYDYIEERILAEVEADIAAGTATYYISKNDTVFSVVRTPEEAEKLRKECDDLLKRIEKEKAKLKSYFTEEEYRAFHDQVKLHCAPRRRFR